ncbi:hypothetical protein CLPUN_46160 [Clostridium puniceum]|uniref:DUF7210 domain-containing protein n=1 Tax=Clostridium puniceum TaxID=29367 RepID=A0A1S8T5C7_9CLOT|nr:hypothetical protein [Clostridium puniceum]OOM72913.1 hypothetical protein CLPUN_46160 [Clostridium puniceum]
MAKKQEEVKENLYNAKALVYITYDKKSYKPGEEFEVRESNVKELRENGYAEVDEKPIDGGNIPPVDPPGGEGKGPGENGGQ